MGGNRLLRKDIYSRNKVRKSDLRLCGVSPNAPVTGGHERQQMPLM